MVGGRERGSEFVFFNELTIIIRLLSSNSYTDLHLFARVTGKICNQEYLVTLAFNPPYRA